MSSAARDTSVGDVMHIVTDKSLVSMNLLKETKILPKCPTSLQCSMAR